MTIQVLVTAPVGVVKQWAKVDPETGQSGKGPLSELPPSEVMPGTRVNQGEEACHFSFDGPWEDVPGILHPSMVLVAGQEFELTYDYDEDGNVIPHGVHQAVPLAFAGWLEDIVTYDDEGNEIRERPVPPVPLHHMLGQSDWVWEEVVTTTVTMSNTKAQIIEFILQSNLAPNLTESEMQGMTKRQLIDIVDNNGS